MRITFHKLMFGYIVSYLVVSIRQSGHIHQSLEQIFRFVKEPIIKANHSAIDNFGHHQIVNSIHFLILRRLQFY
jgi:hypothetical protein